MSSHEIPLAIREWSRKRRAAEEAELFARQVLSEMRGRLSQADLAKRLHKFSGICTSQREISRLECGYPNRELQLQLSRYFRSLGHDADDKGDTIRVRPISPAREGAPRRIP